MSRNSLTHSLAILLISLPSLSLGQQFSSGNLGPTGVNSGQSETSASQLDYVRARLSQGQAEAKIATPQATYFDSNPGAPGTLFQWSYGNSYGGGPDLNAPLVTDRPDFTEASSTVGQGVSQLEIGYTYSYDDDGNTSTKSHSFAEPLLRAGVFAEWLELRIGWNYVDENAAGVSNSGSEDLYFGFKIGLTPQEGILPEMALIPQMTIPTGADVFTSDKVMGGLNWIYGWELSDTISTAGSTQFNRAIDAGSTDSYTEWAQSWTVAYTLSDKVGAYTEYFGLYPTAADTMRTEHYFNGGFTYLLNDNVQWDIRAGSGLNGAATDYFIGTGVSIRSARRR